MMTTGPLRLTIQILSATLVAAALGAAQDDPSPSPWPARATAAQQALVSAFSVGGARLLHTEYPADPAAKNWHYWWQAHGIDVLVDAYERSGDAAWLDRAAQLWTRVQERNSAVTNDYYDDMLWMALALQRLHAHRSDEQLGRDVRTLWNDVHKGWNDAQDGGIAWRKQQLDYKNTPANAPAVILGLRLFRQDGDRADLAFAKRVHAWLTDNLVDADTGFVWDGKNRQGDGRTDEDWAFTYNQGVWIGANVELFRVTGDERHLVEARRTFAATRARLTDDAGLLTEHGRGDGALFKGILVRYLGELAATDPQSRAAIQAFLLAQAVALWRVAEPRDPTAPLLLPRDWRHGRPGPVELSAQLSGAMLFDQVARLAR